MPEQTDTIDAEVTSNGIEVVDVMVNALLDFRGIGHLIGTAPIPRVTKDQRPIGGEACKRVREIHTVCNNDDIRTVPDRLHEQPHAVIGCHVLTSFNHFTPRHEADLKQKEPRFARLYHGRSVKTISKKEKPRQAAALL